jgi:hypothetical protein
MKNKYVIKSKVDSNKWIDICNLFAKSLCPRNKILEQYNNLNKSQRIKIKKLFADCDDIRRKKIPKGEEDEAWIIGIMVDANIIACEYDIDPLTAVLCINPICRADEKIIVK